MPGPNWLSQAELDDLRAQQADIISEIGGIGSIKRPTYTADGYGGYTATYATQSNIPMRLWISSGTNGTAEETRFWGEQELSQTDGFLVVAYNTDLEIKDLIFFDNRNWQVVGIQATDTLITAKKARLKAMR